MRAEVLRRRAGDSDIDVLVEFDDRRPSRGSWTSRHCSTTPWGAQVDLVTRAALRSQLQPRIEAEARRALARWEGDGGRPMTCQRFAPAPVSHGAWAVTKVSIPTRKVGFTTGAN